MDPDCPFCEIVAGETDAHVVTETDRAVAFLDENPAVTGHVLVVPREHRGEVVVGGDEGGRAVFETVRAVSTALDRELDPDGFSVFHTSGPLVGRVDHAHVHVVPRWEDDAIEFSLVRDRLDEDAAATLAERLGAHV